MSVIRGIGLIMVAVVLVSCSSSNNLEGVDLKNACRILQKQPQWQQDLKQAHKHWGIPPALILAVIYKESDFKADAHHRHSSAYGYAQVIDGTWNEYEQAVDHSVSRSSFKDSADFIGWYMSRMKDKYNLSWQQPGELYLTYMLGSTGYKRYRNAGQQNSSKARLAARVAGYTRHYRNQLDQCLN